MATSAYLKWSDALKIIDLLKRDKSLQSTQYLAFFSLGLFSGLRIGDILKLRYCDIKPTLKVQEEKTKKKRSITLSKEVIDLIAMCKDDLIKSDSDFVVNIKSNQCSNVLKKLVQRIGVRNVNISNHTLRKTFSREIWRTRGENEASLILLSEILGHSSTAITRTYLGISDKQISDAYLGLSLKPNKNVKI